MASPLTKAQLQALLQLAQQQQQIINQGAPYGQHWQSSPQVHGSPAVGTSIGPGGSGSRGSLIAGVGTGYHTFLSSGSIEPIPATIPYAGIRTGEIIGHRLWWVVETSEGLRLSSFAHLYVWKPGQTIYGDISKPVESDAWTIMGGVYAYAETKSVDTEISYVMQLLQVHSQMLPSPLVGAIKDKMFVSGTAHMWGDVVEHETGYRAEYAKMWSLDHIHCAAGYSRGYTDACLHKLRTTYGMHSVAPDQKPIDSGDWTGR